MCRPPVDQEVHHPGHDAPHRPALQVQPVGVPLLGMVWDLLKHHPLERIVEVTRGIEFPATLPANVCEVRWRRLVELPSDRPGYLRPCVHGMYAIRLTSPQMGSRKEPTAQAT